MGANRRVAKTLVNNVFSIKEYELITITFDRGSNREVITAMLEEAKKAGAKGMAIEIPEPGAPCGGVNDYVPDVVREVLKTTDCWFDAGSKVWIYSLPFENAFADNERLRYMVVGGIDTEALSTLFENIDFSTMKKLTSRIIEMIKGAKTMRFKSEKGSEITIKINHNHVVAADNGDASLPGFYTPPALVNVVPDFTSASGKIVSDAIMINDEWRIVDRPFEINVEDGKIVSMNGSPRDVSELEKWLEDNGDENSYRVGHMSMGLSPNILELKGNIFYDERVFGSMNWGFGHVSPVDAPPVGQESKTHFDAVTEKASIWIDEVQIMEKGEFIFSELADYSKILLG